MGYMGGLCGILDAMKPRNFVEEMAEAFARYKETEMAKKPGKKDAKKPGMKWEDSKSDRKADAKGMKKGKKR